MVRFRSMILVVIVVCGLAALSQAGIDKDSSGRVNLRIDTDSSSTFEIGEISWIFPKDTVAVPVYLHTDSAVGYTENRVYWNDGDLELLSVTLGPGVPENATFNNSAVNDSTVEFDISCMDPFTIPSGEPIAYLNFEVQCYGYGAYTPINFINENNANFFICNNQPYSPLRDNGYIRTDYEMFLFVIGDFVSAFSGKQHIEYEVDFYQQIPGKLLTTHVLFDPAVLRYDSVTAGPGLSGGSVGAQVVGDTIVVDFPETNPLLQTDTQIHIFTLHFGLLNDNDDFVTNLVFAYAERLDECGGVTVPHNYINGTITVPDHTAEADMGDVWYYNTASYYDVPFDMDSSFPINDFEFHVNFPAEDLEFLGVVVVGGFLPPDAAVSSSDSSRVQINNGLFTNYHPDNLPATVFKLRFAPRSTPAAGTIFDFVFASTPENEVRYDMDDPFGYHTADLTLLDGSIEIKKKSGPGCPTLYIWNGSAFDVENTILAACDGVRVKEDVTDFYLVSKQVKPGPDGLSFQIREDGAEASIFRDFRLMVVDHHVDETIQVTREGRIISIGQPFSMSWARDYKGNDITGLIASKDEVFYTSSENGWFEVSFGKLSKEQISSFTAIGDVKPKDVIDSNKKNDALKSSGGEQISKKLRVSVKAADGSWKLVSEEDARIEPARQATLIDADLIDPDNELILRYSWEGYYQIDVLDFHKAEPFEGEPGYLDLSAADHSGGGSILNRLGSNELLDPVTLSTGEVIDLTFDVRSLPPLCRDEKRDYIFVASGRYTSDADSDRTPRGAFALDANYPNPFNPVTMIRYNLHKATQVELRIYDVRGALVRTLVSEFQAAGEKNVTWDGLSNSGQKVASGVYFYQLKTLEFNRTRKMILLR